MSNISYTYGKDLADFSHVFQNEYHRQFNDGYEHSYKRSFEIESKFPIEYINNIISGSADYAAFSVKQSGTVRGLDLSSYESENEEGFEDVDATLDYLQYLFMFDPATKVAISINYDSNGQHGLQYAIVYNDDCRDYAFKVFDKLDKALIKYKKPQNVKKKVNFICQSANGLYLQELTLKSTTNFDIANHYNDDFLPVSEKIVRSLDKASKKGIILLHGLAGTGKTTYLRYLINTLEKNIIYVSPDMSARVSEPSFLSFLLKYKNSILIIEDAENVIKTREAGENQAVSNLLNITDGILGDGLNFQIICTFNTKFDQIDKALTRKGRMIAQYEFGNLTEDKTRNLVESLYGEDMVPLEKEMSLAEIFNMQEDNFVKKEVKKSFGFTP